MKLPARLIPVLIALAAMLHAPASIASTVTFAYSGSVGLCPVTGIPPCGSVLFEGDSVSGPVVVDAAAAAPGGSFDYTDVVSFAILVGEFFAVTSDNSSMVDGMVKINPAGDVVGGSLTILATALPDAPPTEVLLDFDNNTWIAQALVPGVPDPVFIASGSGGLKPVPVPLPGALALFVPALLVLRLLRRRTS